MSQLISIIIPVFNQAEKIGECLDSILNQTYRKWEVIVVNDGSTDNIDEVVNRYQKKFATDSFHYYSKMNEGSNPTRNYGREKASGDFLLFCDADLVLQPEMLEKMVTALQLHPESSFVYCSFYYGAKLFSLFPYSEERLRKMPFIHTTSLIRQADFPGFDNSIRRFQDWDLWLTMLGQGHRGTWINEPLFKVKTNGSISTWLPKITYKVLPFLPVVRKYKDSLKVIKIKHDLN